MIDCLIVINRNFMRRKSFITPLVLIVFLFLPFFAKAQLDSAFVSSAHFNQYIFPPIIDTNYSNVKTALCSDEAACTNLSINGSGFLDSTSVAYAQRFEVKQGDSVSIMGVAALIGNLPTYYGMTDTVDISIWDKDLATMYYMQSFCVYDTAGIFNFAYDWAEFMLDDTLVLYDDYHIAYRHNTMCHVDITTSLVFMTLNEYAWDPLSGSTDCVPYGVSAKYKPYVQFCHDRTWTHVDDVNWTLESRSYEYLARYRTHPASNCDTAVYRSVGVCPIRALENSTSTDNDSTSTGGGDSYIATVLADNDIELYPNPADEVLNIRSEYNITEIEVIDAKNRVIERWELNTRELTLDVASYKSGTYFIIIKTDKGSLTKKFIVR